MPIVRFPTPHAPTPRPTHTPGRGPVLLLSCMDLRFMDEIMQFMDEDGMTNRYDHITLAGASLGAMGGDAALGPTFPCLTATFWEHLTWAYDLHGIKDVYLIEHRDCGAYGLMLGDAGKFPLTYDPAQDHERDCHARYAARLQKLVEQWVAEKRKALKKKDFTIGFHSFLMGLRGEVSELSPKDPHLPTAAYPRPECTPKPPETTETPKKPAKN